MSNLYDYAKAELERWAEPDSSVDQRMVEDVLELLMTFSKQGHSGLSSPICLYLFHRLASYLPLSPLTGEDDEWIEIQNGHYQNKRCLSVFKDPDGSCYDIDGKIFTEDGGKTWFHKNESSVPVTFPYTVPDYPEKVFLEKKERGSCN